MIEIGRLLLAAVFAVAGIAKLADREGSRRAARGFGAPGWLGVAIPVVELAIAVALVPGVSARSAAAGAAALLALFALAIAVSLTKGRKPDCGCLGKLHSAPAGWGTVARNVALAALALAVASQPAGALSWIEVTVAGIANVIAAQAILAYTLLRRYGRALERIEALEAVSGRPQPLEVGAEAPRFDGLPAVGRQALLVFTDPGCAHCDALLPKIAAWRLELEGNLAIALVNDRPEVAGLYSVEATPSAVLVGADGRIGHALVAGVEAIEALVGSLALGPEPAMESTTNGRARVATAVALAGGLAVTTAAHAGRSSHQAVDPELKAIEDALRVGGQRLLAAAERSRKAIRAQATLLTGKKAR